MAVPSPSPRPNDSLAPARSALAGLWLRPMDLPILQMVSHTNKVAVATCKPFAASRAAKVPQGEGEVVPASGKIGGARSFTGRARFRDSIRGFGEGGKDARHGKLSTCRHDLRFPAGRPTPPPALMNARAQCIVSSTILRKRYSLPVNDIPFPPSFWRFTINPYLPGIGMKMA
jgi:hypothetical protein